MVDERRLVRIREGLYFHAEPLQAAESRVVALLRERGAVTPQDVKDLLGMSRKYAIPFMEYLDAQRLTVRQGVLELDGANVLKGDVQVNDGFLLLDGSLDNKLHVNGGRAVINGVQTADVTDEDAARKVGQAPRAAMGE